MEPDIRMSGFMRSEASRAVSAAGLRALRALRALASPRPESR